MVGYLDVSRHVQLGKLEGQVSENIGLRSLSAWKSSISKMRCTKDLDGLPGNRWSKPTVGGDGDGGEVRPGCVEEGRHAWFLQLRKYLLEEKVEE